MNTADTTGKAVQRQDSPGAATTDPARSDLWPELGKLLAERIESLAREIDT